MKCKFCDGSGKDYWGRNGEPYPCPVCNGTGEYEPFDADIELDKLDSEPQTNEEWRKICSAEEFAEWIATQCSNAVMENTYDVSKLRKKRYWEEWLKKPHQGE